VPTKRRSYDELLRLLLAGAERLLPASETAVPTELAGGLAAEHLRRRAGFRVQKRAAPPPAPEEGTPGPAWSAAVANALRERYLPALPEVLDALHRRGLPVPHEHLPELLERLVRLPDLAERCYPLPGARAAWLAAQHPRWKHAFDWVEGDFFRMKTQERFRLFRLRRRQQPLEAVGWLERCWDQESEKAKTAFLEALETGLSAADLPLLDRAANDPARAVRHAALHTAAPLRAGAAYAALLGARGLLHGRDVDAADTAALHRFVDTPAAADPYPALRMLLLRTLHPADASAGAPYGAWLQGLPPSEQAAAVAGATRHTDPDATASVATLLATLPPDNALWSAPELYRLPPAVLLPLEHHVDARALWAALAERRRPWPSGRFALLVRVLATIPPERPTPLLAEALQNAAWYAPAAESRPLLSALPAAWRAQHNVLELEDALIFRANVAAL
jgi:hypothetical protein